MPETLLILLFLPDWGSLESVRKVHSWLEGAALFFFALLVVFEVLEHLLDKRYFARIALLFFAIAVLAEIAAYPYGQRNDVLSQRQIAFLNNSAQQLKAQAARFHSDIANANARAAEAEAKVASAQSESEKASAKTESFRLEIAKATAAASDANARAAQAKLELAKIKTPRSLDELAQARTIDALKSFAGTPYDCWIGDDAESSKFGKTIQDVLKGSGWKQVAAKTDIDIDGSDPRIGITLNSGVVVEIDAGKAPQWAAAVNALVQSLKEDGIVAQGNIAMKGADPDAVHVYVGKKP